MIDRKTRRVNNSDRRARSFIEGNKIERCSKVRFARPERALAALGQAQEWGRNEKNTYYCIVCKGYHLTSQTSRFGSGTTPLSYAGRQ